MNRVLENLKSPNWWVALFSVFGIAGLVCFGFGRKQLGFFLLLPILIGGLVLVCIVIPILIFSNRKNTQGKTDSTQQRCR